MHGPNGANYPNESVFRAIEPYTKIVIEHVGPPWYRLTVTLTPRGDQTKLAWLQEFESPAFAAKMRPLCATANEQNLDRLEAILASARVQGNDAAQGGPGPERAGGVDAWAR